MYQLKSRPTHPSHTAVPPVALPKPKFQFFQAVAVKSSGRRGTIVGMEYISPLVALVEGITPGWRYTIRSESGVGKQAEEVLNADFEPFTVHEQRLEA